MDAWLNTGPRVDVAIHRVVRFVLGTKFVFSGKWWKKNLIALRFVCFIWISKCFSFCLQSSIFGVDFAKAFAFADKLSLGANDLVTSATKFYEHI